MTNAKKKGSKNERRVASLFTEWTGYKFARTPQSGGLHWKTQHTIGDIVCTDEIHSKRFPFSIECKFHSDFDITHLIDDTKSKKNNKVLLFWEQAMKESVESGKVPLLFFRKNLMTADMHFVAMPLNFFNLLILNNNLEIPSFGVLQFTHPDYQVTFMNSVDLFKIDYMLCYKLARKINRDKK